MTAKQVSKSGIIACLLMASFMPVAAEADHYDEDDAPSLQGVYGGIEVGYDFEGASLYYDAYHDDTYLDGGSGYAGVVLGYRLPITRHWFAAFEGRLGLVAHDDSLFVDDHWSGYGYGHDHHWRYSEITGRKSADLMLGRRLGWGTLLYARFGRGELDAAYYDWVNHWDYVPEKIEQTKRWGVGAEIMIGRHSSFRTDLVISRRKTDESSVQVNMGVLWRF